MPVSLNPSDVSQMFDDVDVTIKEARYVRFDWAGKADPSLCLRLVLQLDGGAERTEYLSSGNLQFWVPTADGKGIDPAPGSTKSKLAPSKATRFLKTLVAAGFPASQLSRGDISVLDGLRIHVQQVAANQITFKDGRKSKEGATELTATKLLSAVAATNGNAASQAADIDAAAIAAVRNILAANSGRLNSAELGTRVFGALMADPNRNAILQRLTPDFLGASGRPWIFDQQAGLLIAQ